VANTESSKAAGGAPRLVKCALHMPSAEQRQQVSAPGAGISKAAAAKDAEPCPASAHALVTSPANPGQQLTTPAQVQPKRELPYAHYRLVDALGIPLCRPQKHPFALTRVYYSPTDVPRQVSWA